jgi:Na+/H+-dicarboxylate symporter
MDKIFGNLQLPVLCFSIYVIVKKIRRLKTAERMSGRSLLYLGTRTIMGSQIGGPKLSKNLIPYNGKGVPVYEMRAWDKMEIYLDPFLA